MLYSSKKIAKSKAKTKKTAQLELFKGQCNDAYWHGIFGGLYLPHLRNGVYHHLLNADQLIGIPPKTKVYHQDFDACGKPEIIFDNKDIFLVVAPQRGGSILCLDLKMHRFNLFDIIARHQENYHQQIKSALRPNLSADDSVKTIHSGLKIKEVDIEQYLIYDNYDRVSLLDHFLNCTTKVEDLYNNRFNEVYDIIFQGRSYRYNSNHITLSLAGFSANLPEPALTKTIKLSAKGIKFSYALRQIPASFSNPIRFGVEFGFRPLHHLLIDNRIIESTNMGEATGLTACGLKVLAPDVKIDLNSYTSPFDLWYFPIYSVSSSEDGLERVYQGTVILISWLLTKPDNDCQFELNW